MKTGQIFLAVGAIIMAIVIPNIVCAQVSISCSTTEHGDRNSAQTHYISLVFPGALSDMQRVYTAWHSYIQSRYPSEAPYAGCNYSDNDSDGSKQQVQQNRLKDYFTSFGHTVVMTGWMPSLPQTVHSAAGEGDWEAEALQTARAKAVRDFGKQVKEWQTPTCSQVTGKTGSYNVIATRFTCTVPFVTSDDNSVPFARSAYGGGVSQAAAIQTARSHANRDYKSVKSFGEPLCSRSTKKEGQYKEIPVGTWYCTIGLTATD